MRITKEITATHQPVNPGINKRKDKPRKPDPKAISNNLGILFSNLWRGMDIPS